MRMGFREVPHNFSHSGRKPTIASPPIGSRLLNIVEEEPVRLLKAQVIHHRFGHKVQVLHVTGGTIGLQLKARHHKHIVNGISGLARDLLTICNLSTEGKIALIAGLQIYFKRHNSEDIPVYVCVATKHCAYKILF